MTGRQDIFQQEMNRGHSAAWDQLWDKAAKHYQMALEEFPEHSQALTNLGLALYQLHDYEQALACYQKAAQVSPNDPLPREKAGQLHERLGNLNRASKTSLQAAELYLKNRDINKAIENWSRVTRLNPENLQSHSRLALVYERLGETQKSVTEYLAVASLLQDSGETEKAVRAVNHALELMPDSDEAAEALSLLRDFKPLPKPARPRGGTAPLRMAQVRQLEQPRPTDQPDSSPDPVTEARQRALTVLAGMLFEESEEDQRDHSSARHGMQSMVSGASSRYKPSDFARITLHLSQVIDLQSKEKYEQAAVELNKAIETGLNHAAAYFDLGFLQAQTGEREPAARNLQHAFNNGDFALGARLQLADLYRQEGRLREATLEYMEALKLADSQVVAGVHAADLRQLYEPLIEAQRRQNDPEEQATLCENIHELLMRPDWRTHLSRARQQLPAGDKGSPPIPLAEILTEARSGQIVESLSKIYDLARGGHYRSAMEEAFYALQHAPTYLPLHTYMGEILLKEDRIQEASAKFMAVARTYSTRGEPHRATELYRRVTELAPMDLNARARLIDQLISNGNLEEALGEYLELGEVYYSLADLELARKTYTEALRMAQQSQVDRSWRVDILHRMADIDLQSLDWRQALRIFEQIRTLQPRDGKSRSNLIELNFRLGQHKAALNELDSFITYLRDSGEIQTAVAFVKNLATENPERVPIRRRLAALYHQTGHAPEAISELDAVGELLLDAGDRAGAAKAIQAILGLNPPNRHEYQTLLDQIRTP